MKKLLSITLTTLLVLFASQAFGQTDVNVSVDANVLDQLTIDVTSNIDLGDISQGDDAVLNPLGGSLTNSNVGSSSTLGEITLSDFEDENELNIEWTNGTLNRSGEDDDLTFTPAVTWDQGGAENHTEISSNDNITADGTDAITLSIGGTLDEPSETGNYSTDNGSPIVFTIENTSI